MECACGCGLQTKVADKNCTSKGHIKGQPLRYLAGHVNNRNRHLDDRAIVFYTGAADARNDRPRRVDLADQTLFGQLYHRGYDQVRAVVVAVDVPRPHSHPRPGGLGLSVDGDQGAPNHPGPHNRPGVVLSVNPSTQAAGAP